MRVFLLFIFLSASLLVSAQESIDLKELIGQPAKPALKQLKAWKVKVAKSRKYPDLWVGYNEGIQIKVEDGTISTIWVEYTLRRTGIFPFPIDSIVKGGITEDEIIASLGKPDESGSGNAWLKWKRESHQLHCEFHDGKIVMVTLMQPDWTPGK